MKQEIKIELNENELAEILATHFDVPKESANIDVYKFEGDQREPGYCKITFTAPFKNKVMTRS